MELIGKIVHIISPLALGVFVAAIYNSKQQKLLKDNKITKDIIETKKAVVAEFCEFFVLNLLLPLFIIESVISQPLSSTDLIIMLFGFICPLIVYLSAKLYSKFAINTFFSVQNREHFKVIVSTFGGGNRGVILVLLIFGASAYLSETLKYFVILDLGNFLFLVAVIPKLIDADSKPESKEKKSIFLTYPFLIIAIMIFFEILSYANPAIINSISEKLQTTALERKFLCTLFAFVALTLRSSFNNEAKKNLDLIPFLIVRLFSVFIVLLFSAFLSAFEFFNKQIMVIVIILLILPPSSLLPSMFHDAEIGTQSRKYINNMTIILNIVYLFLLPVGLVFSFFIQ